MTSSHQNHPMTKWSVEQNILYNTDGTWSRNRRPTVLCGGFTVGAAALATWLAAWLSSETTMRMITWSQSCDWQGKTLFVLINWQVLLLTDRVERASEVPAVGGNTHPQRGNRLRQNTGGLHWVKAVCLSCSTSVFLSLVFASSVSGSLSFAVQRFHSYSSCFIVTWG